MIKKSRSDQVCYGNFMPENYENFFDFKFYFAHLIFVTQKIL